MGFPSQENRPLDFPFWIRERVGQRTLKKLRTLKIFQSVLDLGPNQHTLIYFYQIYKVSCNKGGLSIYTMKYRYYELTRH